MNSFREEMVPDQDHKLLYIKTRPEKVTETGSLYKAVRYAWVINPDRAEEADYIIAVVNGVCQGVFVATTWKRDPEFERRYSFDGHEIHDEPAKNYVRKLIPQEYRRQGMQSPILYGWKKQTDVRQHQRRLSGPGACPKCGHEF